MCLNHYGHEKELEHVWMSKNTREQIAAKLQQGISREKILDDIRDSVGKEFHREHLIDEKDIYNIGKAFGLENIQRHANDQDSVLAWIQEWEESDENPVIYYKLQGDVDESVQLEKDDFMIVVQANYQKHMMESFGSRGICCDTTHGTTGYDFKLNSLLVLDEFEEGIPVAFCLSNRDNFHFMKVFFQTIKDSTGPVSPCWFMSDTATQFFEAFSLVNECTPKQFICTWHVDKAWKEELRQKIKNFEVQGIVYKSLRTILEQTDQLVFEDYLAELNKRLKSSQETKAFGEYFFTYWVPKKTQWGYAYRTGAGINTNMLCEAFHRVFKYKYLKGKFNKRVDKCLVNLIKFNRDKVFQRFSKLTKGKYTSRMRFINDSHKASLRMPFTKMQNTGDATKFIIQSEDGNRNYDVGKVAGKCSSTNCRMTCVECNICSHQYTCNCTDFLLRSNICKHIHFLHRCLEGNRASPTDSLDSEQTTFEVDEKDRNSGIENAQEMCELQALVNMVAKPNSECHFRQLKETVTKSVMELLHEVQNCSEFDIQALSHAAKQVVAIKNTVVSLKKNKETETIKLKVHAPSNKNIDTQRRFYSTKRPRKYVKVRLCKPTWEEKDSFLENVDWLGKNEKPKRDETIETEKIDQELIEDTTKIKLHRYIKKGLDLTFPLMFFCCYIF